MTRKKKLLIAAGLLLLIICLMVLAVMTIEQRDNLTLPEKGLRVIASPLQHAISGFTEKVGNFFGAFTKYDDLRQENEELKYQIGQLSIAYNDLEETKLENIRLKQLLEFKNATADQYDLTAAKVIAENNNNLLHTIVLDKGSDDGIKNNMVVINHMGLIGRVVNVFSLENLLIFIRLFLIVSCYTITVLRENKNCSLFREEFVAKRAAYVYNRIIAEYETQRKKTDKKERVLEWNGNIIF